MKKTNSPGYMKWRKQISLAMRGEDNTQPFQYDIKTTHSPGNNKWMQYIAMAIRDVENT